MGVADELRALRRLARVHGVHPVWRDSLGEVRAVDPEVLLLVLRALGVDASVGAAAATARAAEAERGARLVAPVVVAWEGEAIAEVRPGTRAGRLEALLRTYDRERDEAGAEVLAWSERIERLPAIAPTRGRARGNEARQEAAAVLRLHVPGTLAPGWYELALEVGDGGRSGRALLVSAPRMLDPLGPPDARRREARGVGLFGPATELHDRATVHAGGWRELGRLAEWAGGCGLEHLATLPMTASDPDEVSPYSPLSRRFWNERLLDPLALPELERCPEARRLAREGRGRGGQGDAPALADPAAAAHRVRAVLGPCARAVRGARAAALATFLRARPDVERYAAWRAAREAGAGGGAEPSRQAEAAAAHAYAQWVCEEALEALSARAARSGVALLLDVPLGVRGDGFDVHDAPGSYLRGASAGAPPDALFRGGQCWGFPPPHPAGVRERGHRELALAVRRHARFAGALRLDHVMSLLRLWVVPDGNDAGSGAYVRYPLDEALAVLCLEASRAGCAIVGEDLGTVPPTVRERMAEHGLHRTLVLPFAFDPDEPGAIERLPARALLGVGTHDTPPFASLWSGRDLDEHLERSELAPEEIERERRERQRFRRAWRARLVDRGLLAERPEPLGRDALEAEAGPVLSATLHALADTPPRQLSVLLDDLLGETRRQNAPGTRRAENWRLRARLSLEELAAAEEPARLLQDLVSRRRAGAVPPR